MDKFKKKFIKPHSHQLNSECNYLFFSDLQKKFNLLRSIGVRQSVELTPKAGKLYKVARSLKKIATRLDKNFGNAQEKISSALEFAATDEFLKLKLNNISYQFVLSQLQQQSEAPKG